jgi:hypothetical protein
MASPATEHCRSHPPPHGSARPDPFRHGADPGHAEPRQRSSWGQEGAKHGDGAEATRPFPCSGRPAPSAAEKSASLPFDQASRRLIRFVQTQAKCTIQRSKPQKLTPPNGRLRPSADPSVSSSIGAAGRRPKGPYSHRLLFPCRPTPALACIRTIPPLSKRPLSS